MLHVTTRQVHPSIYLNYHFRWAGPAFQIIGAPYSLPDKAGSPSRKLVLQNGNGSRRAFAHAADLGLVEEKVAPVPLVRV